MRLSDHLQSAYCNPLVVREWHVHTAVLPLFAECKRTKQDSRLAMSREVADWQIAPPDLLTAPRLPGECCKLGNVSIHDRSTSKMRRQLTPEWHIRGYSVPLYVFYKRLYSTTRAIISYASHAQLLPTKCGFNTDSAHTGTQRERSLTSGDC